MRKGYGVSSHMAAPPIHILLIKCANLISHLLHHVFYTPGLMPNIIPSFFFSFSMEPSMCILHVVGFPNGEKFSTRASLLFAMVLTCHIVFCDTLRC